jgi:hypothetical protein
MKEERIKRATWKAVDTGSDLSTDTMFVRSAGNRVPAGVVMRICLPSIAIVV